MSKKEYIQKATELIKNRVIFHAPLKPCEDVDTEVLQAIGLDKSLPIFYFAKVLSPNLCKAFVNAQKWQEFNLVVGEENNKKQIKYLQKNFRHLCVLGKEYKGSELCQTLQKLNINYLSHSGFQKGLEEGYIKVNGKKIDLEFRQFYLYKKSQFDGIIFEAKEFLLNGRNFVLNFSNQLDKSSQIDFEINIPLPRGYYFFERVKTGVKIKNLSSKVVAYFNYACRDAQLNFSCINGLESSTFACINLKIKRLLLPHEQAKFYFNYGQNGYFFSSPKEVENFFKLSQHKTFEMFDIKISSKDKVLDENFNNILPQKIWSAWANGENDEKSEKEYIKIRNSILTEKENGFYINENFEGLKQVQIYEKGRFKRVFIVQGESRYIFAQKTKFCNFTMVAKQFFEKTNEIYLCFGK